MSGNRIQLTRLLRRDRHTCGLHIGGCGQAINSRSEASRDHMIPQAFTAFLPARQKAQFNADWNLQPMHTACNERRRGQLAGNWPLFTCRCHYLQIADGHMYVHDRLEKRDRRHPLFENAVSSEPGLNFLLASRLSGDGTGVGYTQDHGGHTMPAIPPDLVEPFNWFEQARVGIARGSFLRCGPNGERAAFTPSGRIDRLSPHPAPPTFPLWLGHHLLTYDPHTRRSPV